ncbi:MAG: ligase [Gemmatimonadetes bacterium]|nr:ligase [Gemmatimonadota bacterium]
MPRDLEKYRAKRTADATPEPAGVVSPELGGLFVVHQHAARNLHWDLRLELDGVLLSFAVPKGPSPDPADKRLAVQTEDHPIEYADFEGVIPAGNYGAGSMIVWDKGKWVPHGDPRAGLEKGKLLFELRGYKLKGMWTLVKLKKGEKEWLLIKERDGYVEKGGTFPPESVLSGLSVERLRDSAEVVAAVAGELERRKVRKADLRAEDVKLMLCEPRDDAFTKPGWLFELKLDGWRVLAERRGTDARLLSRNGNDLSASFPEVLRSLRALPMTNALIDGEVVTLDDKGHPNFQRLQQRARLRRPIDIRRAAVESPATLYAFDLPALDGYDLRTLPLVERKALLARVVPPAGPLRYLDHIDTQGEAFFAQVERMGLEGIIAKKAESLYKGGRTPAWVKIKAARSDDFVVVGFTAPKGSRAGFGALHLAQYMGRELVYAGRAGSGFDDQQLGDVRQQLEGMARKTPPCLPPRDPRTLDGPADAPRQGKVRAQDFAMTVTDFEATTWVEPVLVAEVRFTEWTNEGLLRHPVFLRFRDDKKPEECTRQESARGAEEDMSAKDAKGAKGGEEDVPREVPFSNLKKVFWPKEKYTKGHLIEYYRMVAPALLPYLRDRPLVLTRYPDGIEGKSFFQKDAPDFIPEWVRTVRQWSEDPEREIDYIVCDDVESLLYVINLGSIPLHMWGSRVAALERPDWCILDLDPKGAPFTDVVKVAHAIHARCDGIELPHYIKTTGSSGLHVMIPLGQQLTYDQCRSFGELLARLIVAELPAIATITRQVERREGKVYVDYLQNGRGKTIVTPYSVRPLPGAPVSAPLEWREVTPRLDPQKYTIANMGARLKKLKADPMLPVLTQAPDIVKAISRLS